LGSFSQNTRKIILHSGSRSEEVREPIEIMPGAWSTGPLGHRPQEQSLVLNTGSGAVVATGCAHPGINAVIAEASKLLNENIHFVTGGFHLTGASNREIEMIIIRLSHLRVRKIARSHCTGERAMREFDKMRGRNSINGGYGARFSF
jgi:7,8-dihydropterin-6-yl-methyl-4-(beta-D-ribofuranosyl)aminobenzene 5'-phosphate synthase